MAKTSNKAEVLKAMNTIVKAFNDEDAYCSWIYLIPDGADDEELEDIADNMDDIFSDAVLKFGRLMRSRTADAGLYLDGKVYDVVKESKDE